MQPPIEVSAALSMANTPKNTIKSRKIAILVADGVEISSVDLLKKSLERAGAHPKILAPRLGDVRGAKGRPLPVDFAIVTMPSVVFDAVFVPGGDESVETLSALGDAVHFIREAYKHGKAIAAADRGVQLLLLAGIKFAVRNDSPPGVVVANGKFSSDSFAERFIAAIAEHRHWNRADTDTMPA